MLAPFLVLMLFGGHAVADYGLQSAYMAEFKVRSPQNPDWFVTLGAHCLIHAFMVGAISFAFLMLVGMAGPVVALVAAALGWVEFGIHFAVDHAKGQKRFSYRVDQLLHYGCKVAWAVVLLVVAMGSHA
jgi:sterol desaturase/sphingolipid hydroxylase (fatty acid hydroxylase superfamily)